MTIWKNVKWKTIPINSFCWHYNMITKQTQQKIEYKCSCISTSIKAIYWEYDVILTTFTVNLTKMKCNKICQIPIDNLLANILIYNSCNSFNTFKSVFDVGLISFILIASLNKRTFQFLWRSIIQVFIQTKFTRDDLRSNSSSMILLVRSDGVNLPILNICWTPIHSLRWLNTQCYICHPRHVQHIFQVKFFQFCQHSWHYI